MELSLKITTNPKKIRLLYYGLILILMPNFAFSNAEPIDFEKRPLIYATLSSPRYIDPHLALDQNSINLISQICEGLISYDLNRQDMKMQPQLAADFGHWNENLTEYTIKLKEDILFHDGTFLSSKQVVFSFDRLYSLSYDNNLHKNLVQSDHILGYQNQIHLQSIYNPLANLYPEVDWLINQTIAIDDTTVKFCLNYPYSPFESLLCFTGSFILSNNPKYTPSHEFLNISRDSLIGTGPYTLDSYTNDINGVDSSSEIHLKYFTDYYEVSIPDIQEILWKTRYDSTELNDDFLQGKTDFLTSINPDFIEEYEDSEYFEIKTPLPDVSMSYLGMNCQTLKENTRKAIINAFNYSIISSNEDTSRNIHQLTSIIPCGVKYHTTNLTIPKMDLIMARKYIFDAIDHGEFGNISSFALNELSSDEEWLFLTETSPLQNLVYPWVGGIYHDFFFEDLQTNLALIGLNLSIKYGTMVGAYEIAMYEETDIFYIHQRAEYNHPSSILASFFSKSGIQSFLNISDSNFAEMTRIALQNRSDVNSNYLFYEVQRYFVEDLAAVVLLTTGTFDVVQYSGISECTMNSFRLLRFYNYSFDYRTHTKSISGGNIMVTLGIAIISIITRYKKPNKDNFEWNNK
ncbi:hypothetical protein WKT22_01292 [Candidatus Lokiarchaeum ossiferum]